MAVQVMTEVYKYGSKQGFERYEGLGEDSREKDTLIFGKGVWQTYIF
jgi:hypothetical protein